MNGATLIIAGGTAESRLAAEALLARGYRVLVSQASEVPFALKHHPRLSHRCGRLSLEGWIALVRQAGAAAVIDAGHPYSVALRATVRAAAEHCKVPLLRLQRQPVETGSSCLLATSHAEAARVACSLGRRLLVTVGTRHLDEYVLFARERRVTLFARMLDTAESRAVVSRLGVEPACVIRDRGPFSLERNLQHLGQSRAEVLVTKESGNEGGYAEKCEAARRMGCRLVVVVRPQEPGDCARSVGELVERLREIGL